jgi:hypothetical protein
MLLVAAGRLAAEGNHWVPISLTALTAAVLLILWVRAVRRSRRPDPSLSGCVAVTGRVLAARRVETGIALDVAIKPLGREPTQTTTVRQSISLGLEAIVGRTFSGFWNPARPEYFVQMVINVTDADHKSPDLTGGTAVGDCLQPDARRLSPRR